VEYIASIVTGASLRGFERNPDFNSEQTSPVLNGGLWHPTEEDVLSALVDLGINVRRRKGPGFHLEGRSRKILRSNVSRGPEPAFEIA
jgi:hypothetical protein